MLGYDDLEAYEDELYHEESSSEAEIDSEVEFQLYSQVHYANNINEAKMDGKRDTVAINPHITSVEDKAKHSRKSKEQIILTDSDVVVISDSPDVIVLSDSECDDSVYTHKDAKPSECYLKQNKEQSMGERAPGSDRYSNHSTSSMNRLAEMQTLNERMGRTCQQIQEGTTMEESGSSGTESDDAIENWMVLGNDKEEKDDDNIQLNIVDCEAPRNKGGNHHSQWLISEKDRKGSFVGYRYRYYAPTNKNVDCRNCGKKGHISKTCLAPKKWPPCCLCGVRGHLQRGCPERYCTNCNMPGHWFKECIERAYWKKKCHRCSMTGHYADACPEIWRQYHLTTKQGPIISGPSEPATRKSVYCYNCAKRGHYGHECSNKWMHNHILPTSSLVYYYDTERDIKSRERRMWKKVEELQDAGLLETDFPAKRMCRESANEDLISKKAKKKQRKEMLRKRYERREQGDRNKSSLTKRKTKHHHHSSPSLKKLNEGAEDDFPRGGTAKSEAANAAHRRKHGSSQLFVHSNPPQTEARLDRKKIKISKQKRMQAKKKIKARKTKVSDKASPIPNNLLMIKQKKKHKKH